MPKSLTLKEFIKKARKIHGWKYDYSKVIYVNSYSHVIIICHTHGEFLQRPDAHLYGQGCPQCIFDIKKLTLQDIIEKAKLKHGDKYDYSLFIYKNFKIKSKIKCNSCGYIFKQNLDVHLRGQGCPNCYKQNKKIIHATKITTKDIVEKFKEVHGNLYGYDNFIYKNNYTKGVIYCEIHGIFYQNSRSHLSGSGCPKCKITSKGEKALIKIFKENNIKYNLQFKLPLYKFRYDFYLPEYNLLIEFHGGQHFKPVDHFGGIESYKKQLERDAIKKSLAREYKIPIIYFTYKHLRMSKQDFEKFVLSIINKVLTRKIIL